MKEQENKIWLAKWIASDIHLPLFFTSFTLNKEIKSATALASGLGLFELNINGKKASDTFFEPGETCFNKNTYYVTYDVTDKIKSRENIVKAYMGNGFYHNAECNNRYNRSPKIWGEIMFLCQIEITFIDGTKAVIATNKNWQCCKSPVTENVWLGGEDYDANLEDSFTDTQGVRIVKNLPFEKLERKNYNSLKCVETVNPVNIYHLENGDYTVEFSKNFAGVFTFSAKLPRDTVIKFKPAECINKDLTVNQKSSVFGNEEIYDTFKSNGGYYAYTPKFVYHGFKYLQISGIPQNCEFEITGLMIRCDNKVISHLETSNENLNKIHEMIKQSISDNMYNVITDCPHREKLGWLEVSHLMYEAIAYNFDISSYSEKIVNDMVNAQKEHGGIPSIVPPLTVGIKTHALRQGNDDTPNDPNWCGAIILVPYYTYLTYGNKEILYNNYEPMKRYIDYLGSLTKNYLLPKENLNRDLGDWLAIEKTDITFVVSCCYYQLTDTMSKIADILNNKEDFEHYKVIAQKVKDSINNSFLNNGTYLNSTQCALALPLYLGIVPKELENEIAMQLFKAVEKADFHLTTGEVALKPLLYCLSKYGKSEYAYRIIMNDTPPSYNYFIKQGKTTLPESWDGREDFSQNHCMAGHGEYWIFENLVGIKNDGIAFNQTVIEPYFPHDLTFLNASYETSKGKIDVSWKREKDNVDIHIKTPANIKAKLVLGDRHILLNAGENHYNITL